MKVDYYSQIHKDIRCWMFNLAIQIGTTDFTDKDAIIPIAKEFEELLQFLINHAEHEDHYFHPFISQKLPKEVEHLTHQHQEQEVQLASFKQLWKNLLSDVEENSEEKGHALYQQFNLFIANYLLHLAEEERIMQLLWNCSTPEELMQPLQIFLEYFNSKSSSQPECVSFTHQSQKQD